MKANNQLLKLSGMAYHGGKTPEHWINIVGINPRHVDGIEIRNGLCYWTKRAELACQNYWHASRRDSAMLTGRLA